MTLHTTALGDHGSLIVLCHGLFGQGRNWSQIGKQLSPDHRVLLVDLPHHGRSSWADDFDYLAMADELAGLLSADDPVTLVGHSMGGKAAMILALRQPTLVARLVVVDISPVAYQHLREFSRYVEAMRGLDLGALTSRGDADVAMAQAVPDAAIRGFLLQNLRRDGDSWRWQLNLSVLGDSLADLGDWPEDRLVGLAPYEGPVLWVAGASSDYVRDEYAPAMARWFHHHRRVTVKDAGHWVHSEQPATFVEVLRRFVG